MSGDNHQLAMAITTIIYIGTGTSHSAHTCETIQITKNKNITEFRDYSFNNSTGISHNLNGSSHDPARWNGTSRRSHAYPSLSWGLRARVRARGDSEIMIFKNLHR